MTHTRTRLQAIVLPLVLSACAGAPAPRVASVAAAVTAAAPAPAAAARPATPAAGRRMFAADLYRRLGAKPGSQFFSPLSVSTALAVVEAGARGETAREIVDALRLMDGSEATQAELGKLVASLQAPAAGGPTLRIANRVWGSSRERFEPAFLDLVARHHAGGFEKVDFASAAEPSRRAINAWVEERTENRIHELFPVGTIDGKTHLVVANAIYFKGAWRTKFQKEETRDTDFFGARRTAKVPLMHGTLTARLGRVDGAQVLELPYATGKGGREIALTVVLPDDRKGLAQLEGRLATDADRWIGALAPSEVEVHLPRFQLETTYALGSDLKELGVVRAFDENAADFSGMVSDARNKKIFISHVVHKAFLAVDEEGTEAAAATGVAMGCALCTSVRMPPPVFRADHPFLFLIRDVASNTVLFMGRYSGA